MFLFHDFIPLWAAARVAAKGDDPYLQDNLVAQLQLDGVPLEGWPGGFMYPPWSMWIFGLFSSIPLNIAKWLWCVAVLLSIVCATKLLTRWNPSGYAASIPSVVLLLGVLSFFPFFKLVYFGQTSWIVLLSLLFGLSLLKTNRVFLSGMILSLATVKFHIWLPLGGLLLFWIVRSKQWKLLYGGLTGLILQSIISHLYFPSLFHDYFAFIPTLLSQQEFQPRVSLGDLLFVFTGSHILRLTIPIAGILAGGLIGYGAPLYSKKWFAVCLLITSISAPFSWSHDNILIFPVFLSILYSLCSLSFSRPVLYLILFTPAIPLYFYVPQQWAAHEYIAIYYPLVLAALWYILHRKIPTHMQSSHREAWSVFK